MNETRPYLSVIATLDPSPGVMAAFYREFSGFAATAPVTVELVVVNGLGHLQDGRPLDPPADCPALSQLVSSPLPGQGHAFLHGAALAQGQVLLSIDPDMHGNITDIPALLARHAQGDQLVFTRRLQRHDVGWLRRLASHTFNLGVSLITREKIRDFNSPMLLISRPAFNALLPLGLPVEAYKFHAYFLHRERFSQVDIVVNRSSGKKSTYHYRDLLRLFLVRLRLSLRYRGFSDN